jgi:polyphosphate kinase 2 (PPK2 family)
MLEKIVPEAELAKDDYAARVAELEPTLFDLVRNAKTAGVATLVVFEGLAAAGKGDAIRALTTRLDPRVVKVHPIGEPRWGELERPWLWRFWMRLPNKGEVAIFDTSWYRHVLDDRVSGAVKRREGEERFHEINELERMLAADGLVLVKLWLHVGKKEQLKRLRKADKDQDDFWDVTPEEWEQNDRYKEWVKHVEEALERTGTEWAPWTIVDCAAPRRARVRIFEAVIAALRERLGKIAPELAKTTPISKPPLRPAKDGAGAAKAEEKAKGKKAKEKKGTKEEKSEPRAAAAAKGNGKRP